MCKNHTFNRTRIHSVNVKMLQNAPFKVVVLGQLVFK